MDRQLEESLAANPRPEKVSKLNGHFFVPSYQRGYRWGHHEVEALLNDIYGCRDLEPGIKYCLQPIVVKERISGAPADEAREGLPPPGTVYYELIDGQQRLTTLYLLYLYLKKVKGIVPRFSLTYETRPGSAAYLLDPTEAQRNANIDFFHMHRACQCIESWFQKTAEQTDDGQIAGVADDMYRHLREQVHVIWYDAGEQDSITLFTRLNVGRIALTNAELVKALLLSGRDAGTANGHYRQVEIATQWDMIEQSLQDDAFWAFLTNRPASAYPARIELIFDLLAKKNTTRSDRFFTFEYFKERLDAQQRPHKGVKKTEENHHSAPQIAVWAPVLELYHLLREWFEDRDLYHKIGYLVAAGDRLGDLVEKATGKDAVTKSAFSAFLDGQITKLLGLDATMARELDYEKHRPQCERLLLLFNVETVRLLEHSSERYPFDSHKKERWSLEHIHAQNAEPLKTDSEWRSWLADARRALSALPRFEDRQREDARAGLLAAIDQTLDSARSRISRGDFNALSRRVLDEFLDPDGTSQDEHSIANLALLSGGVNSALSNGAFQVKRLQIIDMDQEGKFIPVCTRRVFLKYYTRADTQQMHLWSRADRACYLDAMLADPHTSAEGKEGVVWKYLKKPAAGAQP
jgi:hypothetical protein